jgi:two-component system OmpR family sensor kinase
MRKQTPPQQLPPHRAFHVTRRQLAFWYTGVTTVILLLSGLIIYRLIVHARWLSLEKEMQSLATFIEHHIEPILTQAGQIDANAPSQFPELCFYPQGCVDSVINRSQTSRISESIYSDLQEEVCIRLVDPANQTVAWLQLPGSSEFCHNPQTWQALKDSDGHYFHKQVYPLHTPSHSLWGTLHIVRSLNDLDLFMLRVEIALGMVIIGAIGLGGLASWQLAKLAMRPVHDSYQQMEQFTADAAHELRSPLAALRAIVQAAMRSDNLSSQEIQEMLKILNRQSQRLSTLVQDLLMFSEIEQPSKQLRVEVCCLNAMLGELIDEFMVMAISAEIDLSYQIQPPCPDATQVLGQPQQLHRAVANLISNALNYTPTGGQVRLLLTTEAAQAVIRVQDTGVGIAPEEQSRIFDRFYRIAPDRSARHGGSGLGLAITQAIVQAHQGRLTVHSQVGQGSEFILYLPLWK